jgi:hypothetical protein
VEKVHEKVPIRYTEKRWVGQAESGSWDWAIPALKGWRRRFDSVPGHHILNNLAVAKNRGFQSREQYANIG